MSADDWPVVPMPRPTRGMLIELVGGRNDGRRLPYVGPYLRCPVPPPVSLSTYTTDALQPDPQGGYRVESYTLRQRNANDDCHWRYVLDRVG